MSLSTIPTRPLYTSMDGDSTPALGNAFQWPFPWPASADKAMNAFPLPRCTRIYHPIIEPPACLPRASWGSASGFSQQNPFRIWFYENGAAGTSQTMCFSESGGRSVKYENTLFCRERKTTVNVHWGRQESQGCLLQIAQEWKTWRWGCLQQTRAIWHWQHTVKWD